MNLTWFSCDESDQYIVVSNLTRAKSHEFELKEEKNKIAVFKYIANPNC